MSDVNNGYFHLMQGDCLERMKEIADGSVDAVITDPPYGMGFQSNWSKKGPRHEKIHGDDTIDARWLAEAFRVLKTGGGASLVLRLENKL